MARVNENFLKLRGDYLFAEIARRRTRFQQEHPDARVISLGIGDVTRPLPQAAVEGLKRAASEMADEATFKGYAIIGIGFSQKIIDTVSRVSLDVDEIFIGDGQIPKCWCRRNRGSPRSSLSRVCRQQRDGGEIRLSG